MTIHFVMNKLPTWLREMGRLTPAVDLDARREPRLRPMLRLVELGLGDEDKLPEASERHDWPTFCPGDQVSVRLMLAAANGEWETFRQLAAEYPQNVEWPRYFAAAAKQGDVDLFLDLQALQGEIDPHGKAGQPVDYRAQAVASGNTALVAIIDQMQQERRDSQVLQALELELCA